MGDILKILAVSDTHEDTAELSRLLERFADDVQMVIHLGDYANDLLKFQSKYPQLRMVAVAGNCDAYYGLNIERELLLNLGGKKILLTHGHYLGVKTGVDRLAYYALEKGADACFFGHTHYAEIERRQGLFIMNPGSPNFPRGGSKQSYGIVEITKTGEIIGEVFYI
ncbi:MAG: metallophosphoesterase [Defluviitaleaceae bacterium]|nr:metallophosphoesterase [Defluviitaleaceae bacterium]